MVQVKRIQLLMVKEFQKVRVSFTIPLLNLVYQSNVWLVLYLEFRQNQSLGGDLMHQITENQSNLVFDLRHLILSVNLALLAQQKAFLLQFHQLTTNVHQLHKNHLIQHQVPLAISQSQAQAYHWPVLASCEFFHPQLNLTFQDHTQEHLVQHITTSLVLAFEALTLFKHQIQSLSSLLSQHLQQLNFSNHSPQEGL